MNTKIHLGLCIPKGKQERIGFPDRIKSLCQSSNIKIIPIDIDGNLERQGPFDVILHKVLDYHNEYSFEKANMKINKLINYSNAYGHVIVIDDFDWCLRLTNRKYMNDLLRSCEFTLRNTKVFLPTTIEITQDMTSSEIELLLKMSDMKFPIISKSFSAYFDDGAHDMFLLFSVEALKNLPRPCLLQQFCHHGGVLYKIFVIGNCFHICERPSIKDLDEICPKEQMIYFDSFRVSKTGKPFLQNLHNVDPNKRHWRNSDEVDDLLDRDVISTLISRIHGQTGLYLYGIDILVEKTTGNYAVIDINQFPSYSGIGQGHFPRDLVNLIQDLVLTE